MAKKHNSVKLTKIVETVEKNATGSCVSVGDLVKAIESRGCGAEILLPALITFLPTGAIPGVPAVCAVLIIIFSGQMLFGMHQVYIPRRLKELSVSRSRLVSILDKSKPMLKKIDRVVTQRFAFMFHSLTEKIIAVFSIVLAITFFPLAIIPFAILPSAGAVILMALGLLARDGLLVMAGIGLLVGVLYFMAPALGLS